MKSNIYDYFAETVLNNGEKVAVIEGENSWTFVQLQKSVHGLTDELIRTGLAVPNTVIAVLLKKSYSAVVANLAITAAGCVYMNLDSKSPAARIEQILKVIRPSLVITDNEGASVLSHVPLCETHILDLDVLLEYAESSCYGADNPGSERLAGSIDTDPYCIINTSGSTGVPKGVVLNHRSFFDFMHWSIEALNINGSEVVGSLSPIIFDIYSFELCMLTFKGSTLCLIDERLSPFPAKILEILNEKSVSFIFWVPTIMVNIANLGLLDKFSVQTLKSIWFAGEVFPTVHFNKWFDSFPGAQFVNLYGPIEITLDCTYHIITQRVPDEQPIPMGLPCRNTSLLILNEFGAKVLDGEVGELFVRGTSLAMGYYNNLEQTALAFVQNPLNQSYPEIIYKTGDFVMRRDGLLYFKGRADTMVKHLGYRIELSDIEHAILASVHAVINVCVVYASEQKEIIAYCELTGSLTFQAFRSTLRTKLPAYMIPARLVEIKQMPMNANGKIDRLYFKRLL